MVNAEVLGASSVLVGGHGIFAQTSFIKRWCWPDLTWPIGP